MLVVLLGCQIGTSQYKEIERGAVSVKLFTPKKADDVYKVRVFIGKELQANSTQNKKMLFATDSLFYLLYDGTKHYAEQVEFVASGITGCFEYMVYFHPDHHQASSFVFNDRYLTQQEYEVQLNRN
jgi:hypothetical protein